MARIRGNRTPEVLSVRLFLSLLLLTLSGAAWWLPSPAVVSVCHAQEELCDASGSADVVTHMQRDPVTGKPYLPRQELDRKALLLRFEELFRQFITRNQRVEQKYFDQYPLIYVPVASAGEDIAPGSPDHNQGSLSADSFDRVDPSPAPTAGSPSTSKE